MKITTEFLKSLNACQSGINLVATYPDKDPEAVIRRLVADDHWDYANWLLPRLMDYRGYVSYAVYAAELVLPIWEKQCPKDGRPRKAIEAAKRCIDDPSKKNKEAARAAAVAVVDSRAAVATATWAGAGAAWAENLAWTARLAAATAGAGGLEAKIIEKGLEILKNKKKKMFIEREDGQTHYCPFCEATRRIAEEQIAILKEECEEMKWERDLARRTLEEEKKRAYDHGYATGEHDCEEMLDEGKDEA